MTKHEIQALTDAQRNIKSRANLVLLATVVLVGLALPRATALADWRSEKLKQEREEQARADAEYRRLLQYRREEAAEEERKEKAERAESARRAEAARARGPSEEMLKSMARLGFPTPTSTPTPAPTPSPTPSPTPHGWLWHIFHPFSSD